MSARWLLETARLLYAYRSDAAHHGARMPHAGPLREVGAALVEVAEREARGEDVRAEIAALAVRLETALGPADSLAGLVRLTGQIAAGKRRRDWRGPVS